METTPRSEQNYTALVGEMRQGAGDAPHDPTWEEDLITRAADAIEALVKERDHWHERWDRAVEREDWALMDRLQLAAVIEKAKGYLNDSWLAPFNPGETGHDILIILTTAPADALREHDAALVESLADHLDRNFQDLPAWAEAYREGVRTNEWMVGAIRMMRSAIDWLRERARQVREGEA